MKYKDWHAREIARDPEYAKALAEIDYAQRLADSVVAERIRLGITQEQLAERAGTTQARISEIEAGVGNPTLDTLERVSAALRATAADVGGAAHLLAVQVQAFGYLPSISTTGTVTTSTGFNFVTVETQPVQAAANSEMALAA